MRGRSARAAQPRRPAGTVAAVPTHTVTATATGSWLVLGKDGRLTAYAPCAGGLLRWTELRPGGPGWSGPDVVAVPDLTHLAVVQGADTYVHFLGRRERPRAGGPAQVDVVHAIQYQTGRPVTEWRSLGNPHREPDRALRLGPPTAAVDGAGTVHVFARNAGGGVMMRREGRGGRWEPWADLRGADVQDAIAATALSDGRIEVFAPARGAALHWVQPEPAAVPQRAHDVRPGPLPGTVAALETAPGRLTWFWTDPAGSGLVCHRRGGWSVPLGGAPGDGANAVLRTVLDGYDCTVVAHRGASGAVVLGLCGTEAESSGLWWTDTGRPCLGDPALAHDGRGRVVVAAVDPDGTLRVARRAPEPGLVLGEWERVAG
ncbi:PLL family lectin [Streptomyces sp. 7R007]